MAKSLPGAKSGGEKCYEKYIKLNSLSKRFPTAKADDESEQRVGKKEGRMRPRTANKIKKLWGASNKWKLDIINLNKNELQIKYIKQIEN